MKSNEKTTKQAVSSLSETTATYKKVKTRYSHCMIHHIVSFLNKDTGFIAEIGPGNGHFAYECINNGYDYVAFEPVKELREQLIKENIKVVDAFVPPIPLDEETCDVIYASMVLEHLPTHNEASHFCSEMSRVLKSGGLACLIIPNFLTSKEFFFEMHYTHSFVTTKRRVTNILKDNGITVIDVQHVLGWFWVKSNIFLNILRHLINLIMVPMHWGCTTWIFEYLGQQELLWKIRKTFFESLIIIGKKLKP